MLETVEPPKDNEAWAKSMQSSIASLAYHKRAHKLGGLVECIRCLENPSSVVALKEYKRSELTIESFKRAADQIIESIFVLLEGLRFQAQPVCYFEIAKSEIALHETSPTAAQGADWHLELPSGRWLRKLPVGSLHSHLGQHVRS